MDKDAMSDLVESQMLAQQIGPRDHLKRRQAATVSSISNELATQRGLFFSTAPTPLPSLLLGLSLAFVRRTHHRRVYMLTHSGGLSYSKTFVQSLMILPVIVALVMMSGPTTSSMHSD